MFDFISYASSAIFLGDALLGGALILLCLAMSPKYAQYQKRLGIIGLVLVSISAYFELLVIVATIRTE
jgi:hypothetical protein